MSTDISEKGLESLIVRHMTGTDGLANVSGAMTEPLAPYGGTGYFACSPKDFDRAHALDAAQLFAFLRATQPEALKKLAMVDAHDAKDINRLKFLARLSNEIGKRGVIDVMRKGIQHEPAGPFTLFYGTPSEGNAKAAALHAQNRFSVTRQLAYSTDESRRALDLGLFINGLPIATFELKNSLTKQTVEDAVEQAVLQLEGRDGQAVDEQAQVQRAPALVGAVGQLARDRKAVLHMQRRCLGIALRRRAVEQVEVAGGMVFDALAQHVDDAALADLGRQPAQELDAVDRKSVV